MRDELPFIAMEDMTRVELDYYYIISSSNMENLVYRISYIDKNTSLPIKDEMYVSLKGQPIKAINDWNKFGVLMDWFDNAFLLFSPVDLQSSNPIYPPDDNYLPGKIILLDPQTGQIKEIEPSMPDLYSMYPYPFWYGSSNPLPIYNSSLSQAFYLRDSHDGYMKYSLWSVVEKRTIWEKTVRESIVKPKWSPDGKQVAYVADSIEPGSKWDFELYFINQQGEETKITNLSSVYKSVYMEYFSWSPKGDRIAIWIDYSQQGEHEPHTKLSVIDLQKGEIISYCLGAKAATPIWSPDGRQIAVSLLASESSPRKTIVVDIMDNYAFTIAEGVYPVAWIKYPITGG